MHPWGNPGSSEQYSMDSEQDRSQRTYNASAETQLHWIPVRWLISYKVLSLSHQSLNSDSAPQYLKDMLGWNQHQWLHSNSSVAKLVLPCTKKTMDHHLFAAGVPQLWNCLPVGLRHGDNHLKFKKGVKMFLFKNFFCCIN